MMTSKSDIGGNRRSSLSVQEETQQEKSLKQLNLLLNTLQNVVANKKQLMKYCGEIEDKIKKQIKNSFHKVPYLLMLIQIYGVKLEKYWKSEDLYNKIIKNNCLGVQIHIEAMLRMAYVLAHQKQYKKTLDKLTEISQLVKKRPQLEESVDSYFQKMYQRSRDAHLLQGLKSEYIDKDYQKAVQFYSQQFIAVPEGHSYNEENKYFSAKSIIRLKQIFSAVQFKGATSQQCKQCIKKVEESQQSSPNDRYLQKKKFLYSIVKIREQSNQKSQQFKNHPKYYGTHTLLAHYKFKSILAYNNLDPDMLGKLKATHQDLIRGKIKNKFIIIDFVSQSNAIIEKVEKILDIKRKIFVDWAFTSLKKSRNDSKKILQAENSFRIEQQLDLLFKGSYMKKINRNKKGYDSRYFYFKKQDAEKRNLQLYYCDDEDKTHKKNPCYDISQVKFVQGKTTEALKRIQCEKFEESHCFTLVTKKEEINFYVPSKSQYTQWRLFFEDYNSNGGKDKFSKSASKQKIRYISTRKYSPPGKKKSIFNFF